MICGWDGMGWNGMGKTRCICSGKRGPLGQERRGRKEVVPGFRAELKGMGLA